MPTLFHRYVSFRHLVIGSSIVLGALLLLLYVLFQARFLIAGPHITLTTEPYTIHENVLQIEGQVVNHTALTLNGAPIHTDQYGNFSELLVTHGSYTIMTLQAKDRYGRETALRRTFTHTSNP